jgi:hypothetical protein
VTDRVLVCVHRHGTTTDAEDLPSGEQLAPRAVRTEVPRPLRTGVRIVLAVYLLVLAWLSLRPLPVSWTYPPNLTPFASVHQALRLGGVTALRQVASGLLPLAPFGVLFPLAGGRLGSTWLPSLLRTAGGAALLATALEILEGWAPGHVSNVDDILLGTLGAILCHLAVVPAVRIALLRRTADRPRTAGPLLRAPSAPAGAATPGRP